MALFQMVDGAHLRSHGTEPSFTSPLRYIALAPPPTALPHRHCSLLSSAAAVNPR
jgi:hypothetical protein